MASAQPYFTVDQRAGHWWFITPEGAPFFSIALF